MAEQARMGGQADRSEVIAAGGFDREGLLDVVEQAMVSVAESVLFQSTPVDNDAAGGPEGEQGQEEEGGEGAKQHTLLEHLVLQAAGLTQLMMGVAKLYGTTRAIGRQVGWVRG